MIFKKRSEPLELVLYRFLNARMDLSENDKKHFWTINKGFEGEVRSDIQSTKKSQPNVWPASFLKTVMHLDRTVSRGLRIYCIPSRRLVKRYRLGRYAA
jgi:hypothetical protein